MKKRLIIKVIIQQVIIIKILSKIKIKIVKILKNIGLNQKKDQMKYKKKKIILSPKIIIYMLKKELEVKAMQI